MYFALCYVVYEYCAINLNVRVCCVPVMASDEAVLADVPYCWLSRVPSIVSVLSIEQPGRDDTAKVRLLQPEFDAIQAELLDWVSEQPSTAATIRFHGYLCCRRTYTNWRDLFYPYNTITNDRRFASNPFLRSALGIAILCCAGILKVGRSIDGTAILENPRKRAHETPDTNDSDIDDNASDITEVAPPSSKELFI